VRERDVDGNGKEEEAKRWSTKCVLFGSMPSDPCYIVFSVAKHELLCVSKKL